MRAQPEALMVAEQLRDYSSSLKTPSRARGIVNGAIDELRRQHSRIAADEALMRNLLQLRDSLGWCKEVDDAIDALRARLESSNG